MRIHNLKSLNVFLPLLLTIALFLGNGIPVRASAASETVNLDTALYGIGTPNTSISSIGVLQNGVPYQLSITGNWSAWPPSDVLTKAGHDATIYESPSVPVPTQSALDASYRYDSGTPQSYAGVYYSVDGGTTFNPLPRPQNDVYNPAHSYTYILTGTGSTVAFRTGDTYGDDHGVMQITISLVNSPPVVTANNASVTTKEGTAATNTGSYNDQDAGDNVAITANTGTVTKTGTNTGTWSWSNITTTPGTYNVTITADDGSGGTATTSFSVTVKDVPPVITVGGTVTATGGAVPVVVAPGLTITDPGNENLTGATVSIGAGFQSAEDSLCIQGQSGFSGTVSGLSWSYNSSAGVLTLSGAASPATYQATMRQVTYADSVTLANTNPRTITFSIATQLPFPGNGHFYQFVSANDITWTDAQTAAAGYSLYGMQGYLATITSSAENDFIENKLQGNGWLGSNDVASTGHYQWVTGPEAGTTYCIATSDGNAVPQNGAYTNWDSGEPNNLQPLPNGEHYVHMLGNPGFGTARIGKWNNLPNAYPTGSLYTPLGYVVEYGGMPGDPTLQLTGSATVNVLQSNHPPTVNADSGSVTTNEGTAATNTGSYNDQDAGDNVAITANTGTVTKTGTNSGTWSWSNPAVDGPADYDATITANDGIAAPVTTTFHVHINNVAPTVALPLSQSANEGLNQAFSLGSLSDPGINDFPWTINVTWGDGSPDTVFTTNALGPLASQNHAYPDEGSYTMKVSATDKDGAAGSATSTVNVIDKIPPTITSSQDPSANEAGWNNSVVTVTLTANDNAGGSGLKEIDYSVDGTGNVVYATPFTVSGEGSHTVAYSAVDNAGNTATGSLTVQIDTIDPVVDITSPVEGAFYKTANVPPAAFSVTEANPYTTVEDGYVTTDEGPQTYTVTATDIADNSGADSVHYVVDNTPPDILINYPVDQAIYKLGTMPTGPDISISDELDDGASYTYAGYDTGLGTHTMTVTAVDTAGNTSTASVIYQVQKNPKVTSDKTGPVITIKSPEAKTYYTYQTLKIFFGVKDKDSGVATKQATLDGTAVNNLQKIDLGKLGIGNHTFTVTAKDNLGNSSTETVTFKVQVGVLKARIDVMPSTLNLKCQSDKDAVTAIIDLPYGVSEKNIVISTVTMTINGVQISAISSENNRSGFTVKFDRQQVINALNGKTGKIQVTITGALKDGTTFSGTDTITVTNSVKNNDKGPNKDQRGFDKDQNYHQ